MVDQQARAFYAQEEWEKSRREITRPSIGRLGRKVEAAGKKKFVVIDWLLHLKKKMDSKRLVQRENRFSFRSHMPAYLKEKMLSALFGETSGLGMTLLRYGSDDVPLFKRVRFA